MKLHLLFGILLLHASVWGQNGESGPPQASRCHAFIDDQNIWTMEIVEDEGGNSVPILNIITFSAGKWDLRPDQIQIYSGSQSATIEQFSMDTGVPGEPYLMKYLAVRGKSFIGLDLLGNFSGFSEPSAVVIDLGKDRFQLQALDCGAFEQLAEKINQINFDSPDLWEDFEVLQIKFLGQRVRRPE